MMEKVFKQEAFEKKIERCRDFLRRSRSLLSMAIYDLRVNQLGNIFPLKPNTLNLLANDVCNSRCQMCLIWQNKKDKELTPEELSKALNDELFSELKYVGVSGGEPSLRDDLPFFFEAICNKKPKIINAGIITNGIIERHVKERILASAEVCKKHGVGFNIMVSLDGVGEIHDIVRGRQNNFQSATSLLKFFHNETDIPTSFGCTITSSNALYVDELLDFAKSEGLYGRFRMAEYIQRLYNEEQTDFIRSFDDKTLYHLGLFFFRVEHEFEVNTTIQKTYRNIRGMLVEGKNRRIGCPYQTRAVVLTSRGELLYCSPKSPSLGNVLEDSGREIYFSNIKYRKNIIKNNCDDCIHDYHVPVTFKEQLGIYWSKFRRAKSYSFSRLFDISKSLCKEKLLSPLKDLNSESVLIVGWYGTETVGDKAILWSIIHDLKSRPRPPQKILVSSLYPFVTKWTLKELELECIDIVETYSKEFEQEAASVDEVVMGGGPLMDLVVLDHILYAFIESAKNKKIARIDGCGIGPLKNKVYIKAVSEILRLSDYITLRDQASADKARLSLGASPDLVCPDPATDYVQFLMSNSLDFSSDEKDNYIACFLRDWTDEYQGNLRESEFKEVKKNFNSNIIEFIFDIASTYNISIRLLPMHTFYIGGDDRIFNRALASSLEKEIADSNLQASVDFSKTVVSPKEIAQHMLDSKINICMRFHSVLFAETLNVPYIAIDYTGGGKIKAFLEEKGKLERLFSLIDIANGNWKARLDSLL